MVNRAIIFLSNNKLFHMNMKSMGMQSICMLYCADYKFFDDDR